jgi:hypothetical protein
MDIIHIHNDLESIVCLCCVIEHGYYVYVILLSHIVEYIVYVSDAYAYCLVVGWLSMHDVYVSGVWICVVYMG